MDEETPSIDLNHLYADFVNASKRYESPETMGKKIWGLITEGYLTTIGLQKASIAEKQVAISQFKKMAGSWIHGDPEVAPSQVMINLLARRKYAEAVEYAERNLVVKSKAQQSLQKSAAKKAANAKAKTKNQLLQTAIKDYTGNPQRFHSKNQAAQILSKKYPALAVSTIRRHLRNA